MKYLKEFIIGASFPVVAGFYYRVYISNGVKSKNNGKAFKFENLSEIITNMGGTVLESTNNQTEKI